MVGMVVGVWGWVVLAPMQVIVGFALRAVLGVPVRVRGLTTQVLVSMKLLLWWRRGGQRHLGGGRGCGGGGGVVNIGAFEEGDGGVRLDVADFGWDVVVFIVVGAAVADVQSFVCIVCCFFCLKKVFWKNKKQYLIVKCWCKQLSVDTWLGHK